MSAITTKTCLYWLTSLLFFTAFGQSDFVKIEKQQFVLDGKPYRFIGTNLWYGMNIGGGNNEDRLRLQSELDQLQEVGLTNLRIMAASEGPENSPYQNKPILQTAPGQYNEQLLEGLDFLLVEMSKRDMKAVVCLGNFWMWSGGFPQYIAWANQTTIPYPDIENGTSWDDFITFSESFYTNKKAITLYHNFLRFIINRQNSISGISYKDDPTIMSWQLANEPRGYNHKRQYRRWIRKSAKLIQAIDTNHLVSIGAEGDTSTKLSGTDLHKDSKTRHIDYATTHLWIQNWGWYDPQDPSTYDRAKTKALNYLDGQVKKAEKLGKPLALEEFGVPRDQGNFQTESATSIRNDFYNLVFGYVSEKATNGSILQGCNFWSWGGEGRPANPGTLWQIGDELIGDPAHELQGWYSVYDTDKETIDIIKKHSNLYK